MGTDTIKCSIKEINTNINSCSWRSWGERTHRFAPGSAEETPVTREMLQLGSASSISSSVF